MPSMFSIRDPIGHQALRRPVAQKYSMSSIKSMEPLADECSNIFIQTMKDLEGQVVDMGVWLQWYAFDVIPITFQRQDILDMISGIDTGLQYAGIIGQIPALHPWLMGSRRVMKFLVTQPFVNVPDPLRTIVKVSYPWFKYSFTQHTNSLTR